MSGTLFPRVGCKVLALAVGLGALGVSAARADVRAISLPTNDLVYDRFDGRIYASVPLGGIRGPGGAASGVVAIDPESGAVVASTPLDGGPGRLAISDDGRYLYVALNEAGAVRRLDLPALTPGLQFSLGVSAGMPNAASDMAVMPGHPETLAVARAQGGTDAGIAIYDDGIPRQVSTPSSGQDGRTTIAFASSPGRLYAYSFFNFATGFRRLVVDSAGARFLDAAPLLRGFGVDMTLDAGLAYSSSGVVFDPESGSLVGTYNSSPPLLFYGTLVAPDAEIGRVFFLTGEDTTRTLLAFDQQTFLPVGSMPIAGFGEGTLTSRLIRWGRDGLAFRTDQDLLFLVRTPLIPAEDVVLSIRPAELDSGIPHVATGRIDLRGAAPPGGLAIPLFSDAPAVAAVPPLVRVPPGATTAAFPVQTQPVTTATTVTVSAQYRGQSWPGTLRLLPQPRLALTVAAARLVGGTPTEGVVEVTPAAPEGGETVTLLADSPVVRPPASLVIPAGSATLRFPLATRAVPAETLVHLYATNGVVSDGAELTLLPARAHWRAARWRRARPLAAARSRAR